MVDTYTQCTHTHTTHTSLLADEEDEQSYIPRPAWAKASESSPIPQSLLCPIPILQSLLCLIPIVQVFTMSHFNFITAL